jgi:hypothetical protein
LDATTIDVTNAFNATPIEVIFNELKDNNVSALYMNYIRKFFEHRHCEFREKITCGVA